MSLIRPKKPFIVTAMIVTKDRTDVRHRWVVNAEDSRTALEIIKNADINEIDFDKDEPVTQEYFDSFSLSVWEFGDDFYQMF